MLPAISHCTDVKDVLAILNFKQFFFSVTVEG